MSLLFSSGVTAAVGHLHAGRPILWGILVIVGLMTLGAVGLGGWLIYTGATGETTMSIAEGFTITTTVPGLVIIVAALWIGASCIQGLLGALGRLAEARD